MTRDSSNDAAATNSAAFLLDEALSFVNSSALRVAAVLGVADHLAQGPLSVAELAKRTEADETSLYRTMRVLAARGIVEESGPSIFHLTARAESLCDSASVSVRHAIIMLTDRTLWQPVGELAKGVRTGSVTFDAIFGAPFFDYFTQNPAAAAEFDAGMASLSAVEISPVANVFKFPHGSLIADIGGGRGGLLRTILLRDPSLRGILLDQEHVLRQHLLDLRELDGRWRCESGDFFVKVPEADFYLIKRILHDWDDDRCVRILRNCAASLRDRGRILVIDAVIPPDNEPHQAKTIDLLMLAVLPGRERTLDQFASLFEAAGLQMSRVVPVPRTVVSIIEGAVA